MIAKNITMNDSNEYRHSAAWPYHISCGGTVYRMNDGIVEVAVLVRGFDADASYHLPKGTLKFGETVEQCAIREVVEESGHLGDIMGYLGAFKDTFSKKGVLISKTTHYFAIEWREDTGVIDYEHDSVQWMSLDNAIRALKRTEPLKKEYEILERLSNFISKFT